MTRVLLIYPFFIPRRDRSVFRFPPLGLGYIAASLRAGGHEVHLLDCTFLAREEALRRAFAVAAEVVGVYCMVSMFNECVWFARELRAHARLLIAGGPLPTCDPEPFLQDFDLVVRGEGEATMAEVLGAEGNHPDFSRIAGLHYASTTAGARREIRVTPDRPVQRHLDQLPFPARDLFPNQDYMDLTRKKYGYSVTTVMSTRGCPFRCEFCSNVVFGGSYRERSPSSVVDEVQSALQLGYDRISFADDVFTLKKDRVIAVCGEIAHRGLKFQWECLGRVDSLDDETARAMKAAGCTRIYFGIESGSDEILALMHKKITTDRAVHAIQAARGAGIEVGAFFIVCYPGDTDATVLQTLRFATRLPVDYLGLSMPYPLPGTDLFHRLRGQITQEWRQDRTGFSGHSVIFRGDFSAPKMWFALLKGRLQFEIRHRCGKLAPLILLAVEGPTDAIFRFLR